VTSEALLDLKLIDKKTKKISFTTNCKVTVTAGGGGGGKRMTKFAAKYIHVVSYVFSRH